MLFTHPELEELIDTEEPFFHTLVIENSSFFRRFLLDISAQIAGSDGWAVLSIRDKPVDFTKNAEILDSFLPFEINKKTLLTKICSSLEKNAASPEHYSATMKVLSGLEAYLADLCFDFPCDIVFPKLNAGTLLKSAGPELRCGGERLSEQLLDYMELVTSFDRQKLFIMVNLRSYMEDGEFALFAGSVLSHGFSVLAVENREYVRVDCERRIVIDGDLCEIS